MKSSSLLFGFGKGGHADQACALWQLHALQSDCNATWPTFLTFQVW